MSTLPRFEVMDREQNNLRYRLFRHIEPGWSIADQIVEPPTAALLDSIGTFTIGT